MPVSRVLPSDIAVQLLRGADLKPVPWKNGGGVTREILVQPPDASFETFLWRLSVADVAQPGPFSAFEGIARIIVLTRGASMQLHDGISKTQHTLLEDQPFHFAGETPIYVELPDGPTQDFNLMWRRGAVSAHMDVHQTAAQLVLHAGSTVLHCTRGSYHIAVLSDDHLSPNLSTSTPSWSDPQTGAWHLERGDTLHLSLPKAATLALAIKPRQDDANLLDTRINSESGNTISPTAATQPPSLPTGYSP